MHCAFEHQTPLPSIHDNDFIESLETRKTRKTSSRLPSARHIYIVSLLMVQICRITCHKETPLSNSRQSEFPPHHRQTDSPYHTSDLVACLRIGNSNPLL
jgi:hypothetical protein